MQFTLALAAFLLGLAGGPHCAAMCGAACAGVVRGSGAVGRRVGVVVVRSSGPGCGGPGAAVVRGSGPGSSGSEEGAVRGRGHGLAMFLLGRLLGYSTAGAVAGLAVQSFAWLASATAALRPVWTLFHLGVLSWGLMLVVLARQPAWVEGAGRTVWSRVRPLAQARGGLVATGALWTFMPCGLLYSALLIASLSGGAWQGALCMALFATASGVGLGLFPAALAWVRRRGEHLRDGWGARGAGVLLVLAAAWALWSDVAHRVAVWCGLA